jgi:hypothetical protein
MGRRGRLGIDLERLIGDIYAASREYRILTTRQLFYIMVSNYGYPNSSNFYRNYLDRYLTKLRRVDPVLDAKFVDPSREFIAQPMDWQRIEIWVEKYSIFNFLSASGLIQRYPAPILILRGFGSLSVYRDAIKRAQQRNVKRILYLGDHDPSGLMIEQVSRREIKVELVRLAITYEQAVGLPAQRVKRKDTRARKYISKFGDRCWEIEVLPPERLLQIVEEALQRRIPVEFLRESELRQEASKIVAELLRPLRERIEAKAYEFLQRGVPSEEVERRLKRRF